MADKILIVEDELTLQETISFNLKREGYQVFTADGGPDAITKAKEKAPDLIILDIMLPGMDGFEVCRQIRKTMNMPIIMLTARTGEIDRVVGLEVGADDYLTKPFSMRELLARVKAMLRRAHILNVNGEKSGIDHKIYNFGNLTIDEVRHEVRLGESVLDVKPKEYELLDMLIKNKGKMLSRDAILKEVWGWEYFGDSRTVDVHIRWLREKIEIDPNNPQRIITVRGAGYRFEG